MATLYKQGIEISRWTHHAFRSVFSVRSNGKVMVNRGSGWKIYAYPVTATAFVKYVTEHGFTKID